MSLMLFEDAVIWADRAISFIGGIIILYGAAKAFAEILLRGVRKEAFSYNVIRRDFTAKIMIGLEFFVAADLIRTILDPTMDQLIILAVIVAIRTLISYFLDKEMQGLEDRQHGTSP